MIWAGTSRDQKNFMQENFGLLLFSCRSFDAEFSRRRGSEKGS